MSASNGKWELSSVVFFEPFDSFDRHARLGAAWDGVDDNLNYGNTDSASSMVLTGDSNIASDYSLDPFYLTGTLTHTDHESVTHDAPGLLGSEIILGPSTHPNFEGAIERVTLDAISDNTLTMLQSAPQTHVAFPHSAFSANDPILIRTVPLGWSVKSTPESNFGSQAFRVGPIGRYDTRISMNKMNDGTGSAGHYADITNYADRQGVRLACSSNADNENRYIEKYTDVNTFDPRIRRWRMSWDYRLVHAQPGASTLAYLGNNTSAQVDIGLATADNNLVKRITYGHSSLQNEHIVYDMNNEEVEPNSISQNAIRMYSKPDQENSLRDWTGDSVLFSGYHQDQTTDTDNLWSYAGRNITDPELRTYNRANKFFIRFTLTKGSFAALDIDNLAIEHCQDTSKEANGIDEIDEYPEQDSLNWSIIGQQGTTSRLLNGSLKKNKSRRSKDRHKLSAQYNNVPKSIYDDLTSLIRWQDERGYKTCLRPHLTALPQTMVGYIYLTGAQTRHYDLGRVSFTLNFEEA